MMGITWVDTEYTKAYFAIFAANEYLGKQIATIHNLGFIWLVREARKHILAGDFKP
jgi:queuine tRNA-ribosyltransferase